MPWEASYETQIWIFSIGRGMAAFVRTGLNHGFIIDMACSEEFQPIEFIREMFSKKLTKYKDFRIAQAVLSHPHRDHIQQCEHLGNGKPLHPQLLTCPNDRQAGEEFDWDRIGDDREGSAELVQNYRNLFAGRNPPLQTIQYDTNRQLACDLEYGLYYLRPPVCDSLHPTDDNKYGNATSVMLYLRHGINAILFPGDMTPEGMERVLDDGKGVEKRYTIFKPSFTRDHPDWHQKTSDQPGLGTLLDEYGLSILVAPHHGLESCYSEKLYETIQGGKPQLVVISEKRHTQPQDGSIHANYQCADGASGLNVWVDGEKQKRYSVSTANGHHILIVFNGTGIPKVYLENDPKDLLEILD
jgi:hypothetical protein